MRELEMNVEGMSRKARLTEKQLKQLLKRFDPEVLRENGRVGVSCICDSAKSNCVKCPVGGAARACGGWFTAWARENGFDDRALELPYSEVRVSSRGKPDEARRIVRKIHEILSAARRMS